MPNRILREGILTSPRMARLSWAAEVFYRRLHSVVDDFGRFHAHPMLLRAACYPLQLDKVSDSDIGKWMLETAEAGLVRVFEHAGQQYLELLDFRQQVRATKSKFPAPPDSATHLYGECVADAAHLRTKTYPNSESKSEAKDKASRKRAPTTPMPEGFGISERVRKWAETKGHSNLEAHLEVFLSKCRAKGYTYADWDEGFMGCIREDWARLNQKKVTNGKEKFNVHAYSREALAREVAAQTVGQGAAPETSPGVHGEVHKLLPG